VIDVPVRRLRPDATLPHRAYESDAGFDLVACDGAVLGPGQRAVVSTGIAVEIPHGYAGYVQPRSGLAAKHGIGVVNSPGLIDAGYRGEVVCAMVNLDPHAAVEIAAGDRIAQLVIVAVPSVSPAFVEELPPSERGGGGFGSTGES
jgi:dUTP pyrophosphatase